MKPLQPSDIFRLFQTWDADMECRIMIEPTPRGYTMVIFKGAAKWSFSFNPQMLDAVEPYILNQELERFFEKAFKGLKCRSKFNTKLDGNKEPG